MPKKAAEPAIPVTKNAAPERPAVKPTKEEILIKQAQLFKLRERYQQGIAQCNAQINELEQMLKEV